MTSFATGSDSIIFSSAQEIKDYLLKNILANKQKLVGTEWEVFFVKRNCHAITQQDGQAAFALMQKLLQLSGYIVTPIKDSETGSIIALDIGELGRISTEAGHQFEFASSVCQNCEEILEKNKTVFFVFKQTATQLGYELSCSGHIEGYAESSTGVESSRSREWQRYYSEAFQEGAEFLRDAQLGTASLQITLDSGAEHFHEYFRVLLLLEPVLSLHYSNSLRSYVWGNVYGRYLPQQVNPLTTIWIASTTDDAVDQLVGRLLDLNVPFLPDRTTLDSYRPLYGKDTVAPTVSELLHTGLLTEKALNNIGGFFYSRPAFRNFSRALLEIRGIDSQPIPETVASLASIVTNLVYDNDSRKELLQDYQHWTVGDLDKLHQLACLPDRTLAFSEKIAGNIVSNIIEDILGRVGEERFVTIKTVAQAR